MKKRTVSVLLTTCLAAGMLAGCGSTSADTTATPDKTTEETTNETESTDASEASETADADSDYEPVTITLNLERSGLGENVEYTFTKKPSEVVASGDQMADFFFDLGLEDQMAGYTKGSCWSTVSQYPARDKVPQLLEPGKGLSNMSKEELLSTGCDFLIGWDSVFSDKNFSKEFCDQDGLKETDSWKQGSCHDAASHVVQMIRNGYEAADTFGSSYLVLDRYFLTVPALTELNQLNQSAHLLDVITRAKSSCIAYEIPKADRTPRRGRPRKKGEPIKLNTLFEDRASDFISAEIMMYGKKETVQYLCLDLLWGTKLYKKLRFVLVKYAKSSAILVSTDLSLNPVLIIEAYAHRFKIECTFREFKQQIGGFCYHFWTKAMPKLNKNKKKTDASELPGVVEEDKRSRILKTVEATERFILCSCIAMGLVQMMALTPSMAKTVRRHRYLRTSSEHKVSEASVLEYLRKNFFRLLCLNPNSEISRFILTLQPLEYSGNDDFMSA